MIDLSAFTWADQMRIGCGRMLDVALHRTEMPFDVVAERPGVRLRRYTRASERRPPIVIIPAPIKRAYIWDLAPSVSVIQAWIVAGFDTLRIPMIAAGQSD